MSIPTYAELVRHVSLLLPDASFGEDNDGQLIIFTDLMQLTSSDDEPLVGFEST